MNKEHVYRRRQVLGLLLIAGALLIVALLRAPRHFVFPHGWWHIW
jgi:hypothetical protein